MQAFYIENQILNMLGIRGMTIDGITTSTLPNMADTQQVEVSGMQYENIFEVSSPFRINAIDAAYATTAQKIVNQTRSLASRNTSTSRTRARRPAEPGRYHIILAHPMARRPVFLPPVTHPPAQGTAWRLFTRSLAPASAAQIHTRAPARRAVLCGSDHVWSALSRTCLTPCFSRSAGG